jgi:hypothetical protein
MDDRAAARREAATLLGVDVERLSPADSLRVDMVSSLRLVIDHEQGNVLNGNSADLGKLNVAVASLIALLPGRELPEPKPADGGPNDPRTIMFETYMAMRRRGEIADPTSTYEGRMREIERLKARVAELEAGASEVGGTNVPSRGTNVPSRGTNVPDGSNVVNLRADAKVITPPTSDIVPPSELGKTFVGPQRGPDDQPAKSTQVIDGKAEQPPRPLRIGEQWDPVRGFRPIPPQPNAAPASAAPSPPPAAASGYDYNANQDWKSYVEPDGSIRTTPRGRFDV